MFWGTLKWCLHAVYRVQTKLWSLLMPMLMPQFPVQSAGYRKSPWGRRLYTRQPFPFFERVKYNGLCRIKKNMRIEYVNPFTYLSIVIFIITECTFQRVRRYLMGKCDPLMYWFVLHCAYVRKTLLISWIVVNTWKLAICF